MFEELEMYADELKKASTVLMLIRNDFFKKDFDNVKLYDFARWGAVLSMVENTVFHAEKDLSDLVTRLRELNQESEVE